MKIRLHDVYESVDGGHGPLQSGHEKDQASTSRKQEKKTQHAENMPHFHIML